jgi:hypothetical protein
MSQISPRTGSDVTIKGTFAFEQGNIIINDNGDLRDELMPYLRGLIAWANHMGFKAAIWTDLQRNFKDKAGVPYSLEAAKMHLKNLTKTQKKVALRYIRKAPVRDETRDGNALKKYLKEQLKN